MKQEKIIDKILCFMKKEIEKDGYLIESIQFNFSFSHSVKYFNAPDEIKPDGEDLVALKKIFKRVKDEDIKEALNIAITQGYLKACYNDKVKFQSIKLTDKGMARATSVLKATPKKNILFAVIAHPLFNTITSGAISFAVGYYLGEK